MLSVGEDAVAYNFFGILPASKASLPDSAASLMAFAILTGSLASAIAELSSTPSAPSSKATETSDAVPTPASTKIGTLPCSRISDMFVLFITPGPEQANVLIIVDAGVGTASDVSVA